jgi:hypothetical protein
MQAEFLAQIIILGPVSTIIFGYMFYTLKGDSEFYEGPKNLNCVTFAMKYSKHQSIRVVNILSSALGLMFFRDGGK